MSGDEEGSGEDGEPLLAFCDGRENEADNETTPEPEEGAVGDDEPVPMPDFENCLLTREEDAERLAKASAQNEKDKPKPAQSSEDEGSLAGCGSDVVQDASADKPVAKEVSEATEVRDEKAKGNGDASISGLLGEDIPEEYPGEISGAQITQPKGGETQDNISNEQAGAPDEVTEVKKSPLDNQNVQIGIAIAAVLLIFVGMEFMDSGGGDGSSVSSLKIESAGGKEFPTPEFARAQKTGTISNDAVAAMIAREANKQQNEPEVEPARDAQNLEQAPAPARRATQRSRAARRTPRREAPAQREPGRRMGNFFAAGETLGGDTEKGGYQSVRASMRGDPILSLPVTTRIAVVLEMGISSSRHGVALVKTTKKIRAGKVTIPKGTVIRGKSANDDTRIYITFGEVTLKGKKYRITGEAISGKKRGIAAQVRETSFSERGGAAAKSGALEAAKDVAGAALDGVAGPLRRVTDSVAREASSGPGPGYKRTLEVPAGKKFQIIVTK